MDLTKNVLPEAVMVSGKYYKIHTGHCSWFRFAEILGQEKAYLSDLDFLYVDELPEDKKAGLDALYDFYYEKKEVPRAEGDTGERVLDYAIDADMIYAAILQCYGIDLYDKQLHWHKVRAMIAGLHGTRLDEIMGYRCSKPGKNKELARIKRIWALPERKTKDDKESAEKVAEVFYASQF